MYPKKIQCQKDDFSDNVITVYSLANFYCGKKAIFRIFIRPEHMKLDL